MNLKGKTKQQKQDKSMRSNFLKTEMKNYLNKEKKT